MINTYLQDINGFIAYFNFVQGTAITRYTKASTLSAPPEHIYYGAVATTNGTCMFSYQATSVLSSNTYKTPWQFMNNVDVNCLDVKLFTTSANSVFAIHTENNSVAFCCLNTMARIATIQTISNRPVKKICLFSIPNSSPSAANLFVVTDICIEYWTISETSTHVLTINKLDHFLIKDVNDACGFAAQKIAIALASGGLLIYDFQAKEFVHTPYASDLIINEVCYIDPYIVFTDGNYLCSQPISSILTAPLQIKKSFSDLGIGNSLNNFDIRITDIPSDYTDTVISFGTGDGIAKYDLVSNIVTEQFRSSVYPELGKLTDYSPTARKLVGLAANYFKVPFINFQYVSLFSYAGVEMISQKIPINTRYPYKGVKLSIVIPDSSVMNGSIIIYDDNNQGIVQLSKFVISGGVVSGSGLGGGGKICYFDAPLGITTRAFYVSIKSDISNDEIKIYMDEA